MSLESARRALPFIAAGQAQKELTHNEALALIDVGIGAAAESAAVDIPPTAPDIGQCWIVGNAPTDVWTGKAGALACWTEGGWRFLADVEGLAVWIKDQQLWAVREAGDWAVGDMRAARILIQGAQVLGAREPAIAPPAGGSSVDAEARTAISAIIDRLSRTASSKTEQAISRPSRPAEKRHACGTYATVSTNAGLHRNNAADSEFSLSE